MKKFELISKEFPHFLHGGDYNPEQWLTAPEILEADMQLMKEANCNEMTVGIFSWSKLEPQENVFDFAWLDVVIDKIYANGGRVVLATPSGARPVWMAERYPEVLRVEADGVRNRFGERHNHCRTSPVYREKVRIINEKLAERYGKHPAVVAWHLSNEYNAGVCYCENCTRAFRFWLREKYDNDIEKLNLAWWTAFWSHQYQDFEQIDPPREAYGESRVLGMNLDWKRFNSDMAVEFAAKEAEAIRKYSDLPITTNCMGNYFGFDHYKMAKVLDVVSNDFYPRWSRGVEETAQSMASICALYRGMKDGKPFMVMESAPGINLGGMDFAKVKTDEEQFLEAMLFVACGADTVQYFQWRKSRGGYEKFHGAVVDHYGKADNRVFRSVSRIGEALRRLDGVLGTGVRSEIAILRDYETVWALDGRPVQPWSMAPLVKKCQEMYDGFFGCAWSQGVSADIVSYEADFSRYKIVCLPLPYLMRAEVAEKLKRYVENGGVMVSTYLTAVADEHDLCYLGGVPGAELSELFGIRVDEVDTYREADPSCTMRHGNSVCYKGEHYLVNDIAELIVANGAEPVALFTENIQKGHPAVTCNSYGKGRAYYIGYHPDVSFLQTFMKDLFDACDLHVASEVRAEDGVHVLCREGDGERYLFVLNCTQEDKQIEADGSFTDLLTDQVVSGIRKLAPLAVLVLKAR